MLPARPPAEFIVQPEAGTIWSRAAVRENRWQQLDVVLLGTVVLLVSIGLAMIQSTTCGTPCGGVFPPTSYVIRQGTFALLGFGLLGLVSLVDYHLPRAYAYHLFALGIGLLVLVLFIGRGGADADYGARRWIYVWFFDLQPSEVAKISLLLVLARILGDKGEGPLTLQRLLASLLLTAVTAALVFAEPDLGTSLSFLVIWVVMVGVAGVQWRHGATLGVAAIMSLPLGWLAMRDYMRERVMTFIGTLVDVEHAALEEGYNVLQARISIGSGGLVGRGYQAGTQTQLDYLLVQHSDFIFSALAEELGFIGATALLTLFVLLLFRITRAGDRARDNFGRYLAFGIAAMFLFQAVANMGANLTLLPVTGIPLPFVSYGRTALLTNLVSIGMVESILLYRIRYRY